nr:hypothetical protein [uncultured Campylobacter sp.]
MPTIALYLLQYCDTAANLAIYARRLIFAGLAKIPNFLAKEL